MLRVLTSASQSRPRSAPLPLHAAGSLWTGELAAPPEPAMFQPRKPAGGGSNFDPLQALTAAKPAGREVAQSQRDGPLLLRVVDDLAQAALKARNDFMAELNAADVQRRDVHAAAKARLEAELGQMAQTAAKLSDRLFFATRGMISLVRSCAQRRAALFRRGGSRALRLRSPLLTGAASGCKRVATAA